jgi:hypothetical protein
MIAREVIQKVLRQSPKWRTQEELEVRAGFTAAIQCASAGGLRDGAAIGPGGKLLTWTTRGEAMRNGWELAWNLMEQEQSRQAAQQQSL